MLDSLEAQHRQQGVSSSVWRLLLCPRRSLEAAIFLFTRVARIPEGSLVLPGVCTEERLTLGAELQNGALIRGQNNISHPPAEEKLGDAAGAGGRASLGEHTVWWDMERWFSVWWNPHSEGPGCGCGQLRHKLGGCGVKRP